MCGVKRKLMIKANVRDQEAEIEAGYKWLCFYCLLNMLDLIKFGKKIDVNRKAIMQNIEED